MQDQASPPPPPFILGRCAGTPNSELMERSSVEEATRETIEFVSGAMGSSDITIFRSTDNEDRGGLVIRFAVDDHGSSFVPAAISNPDGVDVHIAGDAEAEAMVIALQRALTTLNADRARKKGVLM